jgi:predicted CXXCH cytochrome family protein
MTRAPVVWSVVLLLGALAARAGVLPQGPDGQAPSAPGVLHPELPDTTAETCLTCHSDVGEHAVVHGAVAAGLCDSCHAFDGKGDETRVTLAGGVARDDTLPLCTTCHEDIATQLTQPFPHAPVAAGDCLTCHDPHGSANRFMLKAADTAVCVTCHADTGELLKAQAVHPPAAADCATCHDPHGASHRAMLREAINPLCLACHGGSPPAAAANDPPTLFGRGVDAPVSAMAATERRIGLDPLHRRGHPVVGHPVGGVPDPTDPGRTLSCGSCHEPHGRAGPSLLRSETGDPTQFCVNCHK